MPILSLDKVSDVCVGQPDQPTRLLRRAVSLPSQQLVGGDESEGFRRILHGSTSMAKPREALLQALKNTPA